jgi:hypothetical protein
VDLVWRPRLRTLSSSWKSTMLSTHFRFVTKKGYGSGFITPTEDRVAGIVVDTADAADTDTGAAAAADTTAAAAADTAAGNTDIAVAVAVVVVVVVAADKMLVGLVVVVVVVVVAVVAVVATAVAVGKRNTRSCTGGASRPY